MTIKVADSVTVIGQAEHLDISSSNNALKINMQSDSNPNNQNPSDSIDSISHEVKKRLYRAWLTHRRDVFVVVCLCASFIILYYVVDPLPFSFGSTSENEDTNVSFREVINNFMVNFDGPLQMCCLGASRGVFGVWLPILTGSTKVERRWSVLDTTRYKSSEQELSINSESQSNSNTITAEATLNTESNHHENHDQNNNNRNSDAPTLFTYKHILFLSSFNFIYYGCCGFGFYYYFRLLTLLFGDTPNDTGNKSPHFYTIALAKVLFDLAVVAPIIFVPMHQLGSRWRDNFGKFYPTYVKEKKLFSKRSLLTEWHIPGWATEIMIVGPILILLFILPLEIQAPVNAFFGILVVIFHTSVSRYKKGEEI